jgi:excisionase family DNA binding protein
MAVPGIIRLRGLLTTREVAALLGVTNSSIWNAVQVGHLPAVKVGNALAMEPADVAVFREKYLRGEVTTTSAAEPAKKGRPPEENRKRLDHQSNTSPAYAEKVAKRLDHLKSNTSPAYAEKVAKRIAKGDAQRKRHLEANERKAEKQRLRQAQKPT